MVTGLEEALDPPRSHGRGRGADAEVLLASGLLGCVLVIGLATVGDYGITVDEFNADDYGSKALAWYTSGFTDRSSFESVEDMDWHDRTPRKVRVDPACTKLSRISSRW